MGIGILIMDIKIGNNCVMVGKKQYHAKIEYYDLIELIYNHIHEVEGLDPSTLAYSEYRYKISRILDRLREKLSEIRKSPLAQRIPVGTKDVIFVQVQDDLSRNALVAIRKQLERKFPDNVVIIGDYKTMFGVMPKEEFDRINKNAS